MNHKPPISQAYTPVRPPRRVDLNSESETQKFTPSKYLSQELNHRIEKAVLKSQEMLSQIRSHSKESKAPLPFDRKYSSGSKSNFNTLYMSSVKDPSLPVGLDLNSYSMRLSGDLDSKNFTDYSNKKCSPNIKTNSFQEKENFHNNHDHNKTISHQTSMDFDSFFKDIFEKSSINLKYGSKVPSIKTETLHKRISSDSSQSNSLTSQQYRDEAYNSSQSRRIGQDQFLNTTKIGQDQFLNTTKIDKQFRSSEKSSVSTKDDYNSLDNFNSFTDYSPYELNKINKNQTSSNYDVSTKNFMDDIFKNVFSGHSSYKTSEENQGKKKDLDYQSKNFQKSSTHEYVSKQSYVKHGVETNIKHNETSSNSNFDDYLKNMLDRVFSATNTASTLEKTSSSYQNSTKKDYEINSNMQKKISSFAESSPASQFNMKTYESAKIVSDGNILKVNENSHFNHKSDQQHSSSMKNIMAGDTNNFYSNTELKENKNVAQKHTSIIEEKKLSSAVADFQQRHFTPPSFRKEGFFNENTQNVFQESTHNKEPQSKINAQINTNYHTSTNLSEEPKTKNENSISNFQTHQTLSDKNQQNLTDFSLISNGSKHASQKSIEFVSSPLESNTETANEFQSPSAFYKYNDSIISKITEVNRSLESEIEKKNDSALKIDNSEIMIKIASESNLKIDSPKKLHDAIKDELILSRSILQRNSCEVNANEKNTKEESELIFSGCDMIFKKLPAESLQYEGEKNRKGEMDGFGTMTYTPDNLVIYEGEWKDGCFNGRGILRLEAVQPKKERIKYENLSNFWEYALKYEGDFMNGKADGIGTIYFASGQKYSGQLEHDWIMGLGTFVESENGEKITGEWNQNKISEVY